MTCCRVSTRLLCLPRLARSRARPASARHDTLTQSHEGLLGYRSSRSRRVRTRLCGARRSGWGRGAFQPSPRTTLAPFHLGTANYLIWQLKSTLFVLHTLCRWREPQRTRARWEHVSRPDRRRPLANITTILLSTAKYLAWQPSAHQSMLVDDERKPVECKNC